MRDVFYFETRITCSGENSSVCLLLWGTVSPRWVNGLCLLCVYLCGFAEGHFVWLKEESREKNNHALTGHSALTERLLCAQH